MVGYEEIITVLGVVGIGGIVATSITYILEKRKQIKFREQELKETRYKIIIAKMGVLLNSKYLDNIIFQTKKEEKTIDSEWVKKELEMEWFNSWLFASDDVVYNLKAFILQPNNTNYGKTVLAMRKDLWNKKTDLKAEECSL